MLFPRAVYSNPLNTGNVLPLLQKNEPPIIQEYKQSELGKSRPLRKFYFHSFFQGWFYSFWASSEKISNSVGECLVPLYMPSISCGRCDSSAGSVKMDDLQMRLKMINNCLIPLFRDSRGPHTFSLCPNICRAGSSRSDLCKAGKISLF